VNATLAVMGLLAAAFLFGSVVWFANNRTVWRFLQLFGSACLIVVVLTHIAEMFDLFPSGMGSAKQRRALPGLR
jgi:MFS family permease